MWLSRSAVECLNQEHRVDGACRTIGKRGAKDGRIAYDVLRVGMWLRIVGSFSDPPNFSKLLLSPLVVAVAVYMEGHAGQMSNQALSDS